MTLNEAVERQKEPLLQTLCESIRIRSVQQPAQEGAPYGPGVQQCLEHALAAARALGFATVDLMCVDLFSGETCFYKYGAAPSYVKSGKSIRRIKGETLAAGLSSGEGIAPDLVRMRLRPGSTAIIASDGVIVDTEDDWIKNLLMRGTDDMKALARGTLKEAEKVYGANDDMTVVTVRVEERV